MELEIGSVFEGRVTGITKFGAFVQLPVGKSGMVHISEVANEYVEDISKHLQIGQTVKVKLVAIDQQGRINLSIKKALPQPEGSAAERPPRPAFRQNNRPAQPKDSAPRPAKVSISDLQFAQDQSTLPRGDDSFESKLKAFMQSSESRISDLKSQNDKRSGGRRRK